MTVTPAILVITAVPVGLFIAAWSVVGPNRGRVGLLVSRLAFLETEPVDDPEENLKRPFADRIVRPALDAVGGFMLRRTPQGQTRALEVKLTAGGGLWGLTAARFYAIQLILAFVGAGLGFFLATSLGMEGVPLLAVLAVGPILGFMVPRTKLIGRIKQRRKAVLRVLSSMLDLLTMSVEAGLSFDASVARIIESYDNPFSEELNIALNGIKLGQPRASALQSMGERLSIEEVDVLIQAIIQSERMGTSLGQTLRIQSEELRRRQAQRAEETAAQAPLKMLFPMVGCIFPTIFVILLGPAALKLIHGG